MKIILCCVAHKMSMFLACLMQVICIYEGGVKAYF